LGFLWKFCSPGVLCTSTKFSEQIQGLISVLCFTVLSSGQPNTRIHALWKFWSSKGWQKTQSWIHGALPEKVLVHRRIPNVKAFKGVGQAIAH
jgi:hypothetical protein